MRGRRDLARDLHQILKSADRIELTPRFQFLREDFKCHRRALLVKLNNDLEKQLVGGRIKAVRNDARFQTARNGIAAVDQTARDDMLLRLAHYGEVNDQARPTARRRRPLVCRAGM